MGVRTLLLENIHKSAHKVLSNAKADITAHSKAMSEDELIENIKGVQLLGIRSKTKITRKVLEAGRDSLLAIGCFCIGTNQVDLKAANEFGIPVFNAPFANTRSVAELVIAEVISLGRQLFDRSAEAHRGEWKKSAIGCFEVRGKTLGIIGYGHIGAQIGVLAESMGMRVIFYDVVPKLPMGNNVPLESMQEVLEQADFVTVHVPEIPTTVNLMNKETIALMKKGAYLVNNSRGTVVDLDALADALKSGALAGAAVDVFPVEPEGNGAGFVTPLQGLSNVILTPHIGGSTMEAQEEIGKEVGTAFYKYVCFGSTTGAVNFPTVEPPSDPKNCHRIINIHKNVPGVLRAINRIIHEDDANIISNVLSTDSQIGVVVFDVVKNKEMAEKINEAIVALPENIQGRIIF